MKRRNFISLVGAAPAVFSTMSSFGPAAYASAKRTRIGIAGLSHSHVHWILARMKDADIEITGIAEPDRSLAERYARQYGFSMNIVHDTLSAMLAAARPDAVTAFNSIFGHLEVVEHCAPLGIHVMVEKPLAVSMEHARKMKQLADKHRIQLLTNYETTWYGTHAAAWQQTVQQKSVGEITKIVFHTGHQGPKEIGVNTEFLEWLTDPVLNGGGALIDFGCYGANLSTWLLKGQKPVSVSCTTRQLKPNIYPRVDDDCTIVVNYPRTQAIIQASWNWPYNIKDTRIYGDRGYVFCHDKNRMSLRIGDQPSRDETVADNKSPLNDPFVFLGAVLRGEHKPAPFDLSSLENNMIVVQILEAARTSAKEGKVVVF